MGHHPYELLDYKGVRIQIDEDIAPLIFDMWRLGIDTYASCQSTCSLWCRHENGIVCDNFVWINFHEANDLAKLLNQVAEFEPFDWDKMDNATMYGNIIGTNANDTDRWVIHYSHNNRGVVCHSDNARGIAIEDGCPKNDFHIAANLYFPRKHLAYVEGRLRLAVDNIGVV